MFSFKKNTLLFIFACFVITTGFAQTKKFTFTKNCDNPKSEFCGKSVTVQGKQVAKILFDGFDDREKLVFVKQLDKEVLITTLYMIVPLEKSLKGSKKTELFDVSEMYVPKGMGDNLFFKNSGAQNTYTLLVEGDTDKRIKTIYMGVNGGKREDILKFGADVIGGFANDTEFEKFKAMFK